MSLRSDAQIHKDVVDELAFEPSVDTSRIAVAVADGIVTLSGSVPTVLEAMIAYRTVQQTPGVKSVVDKLQFVVPDGRVANPLLSNGRPIHATTIR